MKPKAHGLMSFALLVAVAVAASAAQQLDVQIIDRQNSQTAYSYTVLAQFHTSSSANVNCFGELASSCTGSASSSGYATGPRTTSYDVMGATLSLQLPDGRIAVVNCDSKYRPRGDYINRRSCRIPLVNKIQAEFDGSKAKLKWTVSIDGKKMESETYKILAVLNAGGK